MCAANSTAALGLGGGGIIAQRSTKKKLNKYSYVRKSKKIVFNFKWLSFSQSDISVSLL
jgi:hypothetical protein